MIKGSQPTANVDPSEQDVTEARCECGQLVAKLGISGVELKCKRCKRLVSIPLTALAQSEVVVQLCTSPKPTSTSPS